MNSVTKTLVFKSQNNWCLIKKLNFTAGNTGVEYVSHQPATAVASVVNGSKDDEHLHGDTGIWNYTVWRHLGGTEFKLNWTCVMPKRWFTFLWVLLTFWISALKQIECSRVRAHHNENSWLVSDNICYTSLPRPMFDRNLQILCV